MTSSLRTSLRIDCLLNFDCFLNLRSNEFELRRENDVERLNCARLARERFHDDDFDDDELDDERELRVFK